MNRRNLLKMLCVAPVATIIKPTIEKEAIKPIATTSGGAKIVFSISGTEMIGVLNRSGARLNRLKHLS